ncbi:16S rRNA (cytosine(967)-C(5))-methyltransferase RsmB [Halochromatium glycolicum]|uniref:16S rRNA (cytosine(967)-C(5))-methyltransferase n=1 Tax=Halochromatium glycolicum TaxID=85075 RepID=A0AAJ0U0J3_9GAMM|nr:16S rRNA (cytosine(967)-C(5))-methyltransferase RsmB [Halochromatium glycolicum]MBK1703119.1 16S rRNA (cytosine(967)-C(5))-methyltransferase [Halochromatium glycolicum]
MRSAPSRAKPVSKSAQAGSDAAAKGAAVRASAARLVHAVRADGRSLTDALAASAAQPAARDEALLSELAFGTLRLLPRLEAIADQLLQRPLKPNDRIIGSLLLVGLYQLIALRIPDHAAVSATVAATRQLERPRAAGLINATLRRFQRERSEILAEVERDDQAHWLLPQWLLQRIRQAWPNDWQAIATASSGRGPMFVRINPLQIAPSAYAERLAAAGIEADPLSERPGGLRLQQPLASDKLPGFAEGEVSIQDAGAQWAAPLLAPQPSERVLDACAAPGGKTAHLLEYTGGRLELTALDSSAKRLEALRANLRRLGLDARVRIGDAGIPDPSWADGSYQRILLDAPCSATGVIRRHPDIKCLRRDKDIAALVQTQAALLDALWQHLAPNGKLLYVTCSLLPDENEEQITAFLARQHDARERPLPAKVGRACRHGRQLLPTEEGPDGFYFALLQKDPASGNETRP